MLGIIKLIFVFILIVIIVVIINGFLLARKIFSKGMGQEGFEDNRREDSFLGEDMAEDPVCKKYISTRNAPAVKDGGDMHFFCSNECRDKFIKDKED